MQSENGAVGGSRGGGSEKQAGELDEGCRSVAVEAPSRVYSLCMHVEEVVCVPERGAGEGVVQFLWLREGRQYERNMNARICCRKIRGYRTPGQFALAGANRDEAKAPTRNLSAFCPVRTHQSSHTHTHKQTLNTTSTHLCPRFFFLSLLKTILYKLSFL